MCSPNPDMSRFKDAGALVVEDGDWYGALKRLRDEACYNALTEGLRRKVLALAGVEDQAGRLLDIIAAMGGGRS